MRKSTKTLLNQDSKKFSWSHSRDVSITIIGWILISCFFIWILSFIGHAILILLLSALFAFALAPGVKFFEKFIPRGIAIVVVYLIVLSIFISIIYFVITSAVDQLSGLVFNIKDALSANDISKLPFVNLLNSFGTSNTQIKETGIQFSSQVSNLSKEILPIVNGVLSSLIDIIIFVVLSVYLIVDGQKMLKWINQNSPTSQKYRIKFLLKVLQKIVGGYIRGQILLSIIIGTLVAVGMFLLHVPYAILLGILAFICEFIPILGTLLSGSICIVLGFTQGVVTGVLVLIYFSVIHVLEGDILGPRIVGKAVGLHPLVSILAVIIGTELFGVIGALFASPVAGVIQAIVIAVWTELKATTNIPDSEIKELAK